MNKKIAITAVLASLAVGPAIAQSQPPAQTPATPKAQTTPNTNTTMTPSTTMTGTFLSAQTSDQHLGSTLIGLDVEGSDNKNIGEINDLVVANDGKIVAAVVGVGGFLGVGEKSVAIPFEKIQVTKDGNDWKAKVAMSKAELEKAPDFKTMAEAEKDKKSPPAKSPPPKNTN